MARVREILAGKGKKIETIPESESVLAATQRMIERRIGSLVVMETDGAIAGIVTERDVLWHVVAARRDPADVTVGAIMTRQVICCNLGSDIDEARSILKNHRIRHLPVVNDDGQLEGIISIGDLNAHAVNETQVTIQYLNEYIHGRV